MTWQTTESRFVGITVMPEYLCSEADEFIDRLVARTGATAVVTTPCVVEPADEATGYREPPVKGALLDRPLWGRRNLFIRIAPSFEADASLYEGYRYQPPRPTELTARSGHLIADFIDAAKARGLRADLRVQAAAPPGFRAGISEVGTDDEPRLPTGDTLPDRLDQNGSLASPHIKAYIGALLRDLCAHYPNVDGFHLDWPEYPPYSLQSVFFDFCDHARDAADRMNFDYWRMRADALEARAMLLGRLSNADIPKLATRQERQEEWHRVLNRFPGLADLFRFKSCLVEDFLADCRATVAKAGGPAKKIGAMAFPPPWTAVSGFDYAGAGKHCHEILLKLIPSHWPMLLRAYGDDIAGANPHLGEPGLVNALSQILDIGGTGVGDSLDAYCHPADGEAFSVDLEAQRRKIQRAQVQAGDTPVVALVHSGGPLEDFQQRLALSYAAAGNKVWINRYGFLTNEKLDAIGHATQP